MEEIAHERESVCVKVGGGRKRERGAGQTGNGVVKLSANVHAVNTFRFSSRTACETNRSGRKRGDRQRGV